jgi:hypothetical protein
MATGAYCTYALLKMHTGFFYLVCNILAEEIFSMTSNSFMTFMKATRLRLIADALDT